MQEIGDSGSIPGLGRSPRERNGNPLQYSSLEYSKDRGDWRATVSGVATVRHDLATKSPQPTRWHNLQAVGSVHPSFSAMKATNE